ncbi:MAG: hypothetical protein QOI99_1245 [Actinomycetota bacterium]|jgi:hypothetical protein|nr:hypothetical protein [Actinomycetota bacterium]
MLRRRRKLEQRFDSTGNHSELGTIRVPSGSLVIIDAGYLGAWSGTAEPTAADLPIDDDELRARIDRSVDLRVVGPDARAAAAAFDRQQLTYLYDVPAHGVHELRASFDSLCGSRRFDARLEEEPRRISHRERVRRCTEAGGAEFLLFGVPVVAVGGIPSDRELLVTGAEVDYGGRVGPRWAEIRVHLNDAPAVGEHRVGVVGVDYARLMLGDADALGDWQHERPIDGLADVAYWGASADQARAELGGDVLDAGSTYGWTDLEIEHALRLGLQVERWKDEHPTAGLATDFRPHSHHWAVLEQARRSPHGAGALDLAGARLLMFFTSWGDGLYPVVIETSADGVPAAVRIQLGDEERRLRTERVFSG